MRSYDESQNEQWEREHDLQIIWKCPQCDFSYEAPRHWNEAIECPTCKMPTRQDGETYRP